MQNNYMYARMKKSLPELYAFTICMWLKSKALAGLGTPFSYSVPSQANEIVLLEWGTNPLELLINDKVSPDGAGREGSAFPRPLPSISWCSQGSHGHHRVWSPFLVLAPPWPGGMQSWDQHGGP